MYPHKEGILIVEGNQTRFESKTFVSGFEYDVRIHLSSDALEAQLRITLYSLKATLAPSFKVYHASFSQAA
ncbi:MAG: hypothetical protein HRU06_13590 [Oceanospirillaceae bacterium]|nr:hypothetical protein [Oceanospirillaceae bacterium]